MYGPHHQTTLVGMWNDYACDEPRNFICKTSVSPDYPPNEPAGCEMDFADFNQFLNGCYKYFDMPKTFDEAEDFCKSQAAHLVSIIDEVELAYVLTQIPAGDIWIGLSNKQVMIIFLIIMTLKSP